jgi:peptidoglycan/LPS O-acetylase OafA/YrhL
MRKLTHFDGLRGLAAFIVVLAHFRPTFCLNINEQVLNVAGITGEKSRIIVTNFLSLFYEGGLPVFIFWMMSAYVISLKLFQSDKVKSENYLIEASTKRYFRLAIPVVVASFFCFVLMKLNMMYNITLANALGTGYADGWLNQQYHFDAGFFHFVRTSFVEVFMNGNCNYNFVLWTMAPELLGSLMCFALFAIIGTNKKRYLIYVVSIVLLTFGGFRDVTYFFYLTFFIGMLWCDVMNSKDEDIAFRPALRKIFNSKSLTVFLMVISFAIPIYSEAIRPLPRNLYYLFAFPVKAVAIVLAVHQFKLMRKLMTTRVMRFMGKISFSMYLLHIPVLFSLGAYMYLNAGIPDTVKLPAIFVAVFAALISISFLFEKYVDRTAIKLSNKVGKYFSSTKRIPDAQVQPAVYSSQI